MKYPTTPDGRYFVVKHRLWRCTNPNLDDDTRQRRISDLMAARRAVKIAKASGDAVALKLARVQVHRAKVALGERGPTWWDDDSDYNRCLIQNSPYASWWVARNSND